MRKLIYAAVGAGALVAAAGLHYAIPRVSTAQIVGVEVKRVDAETGTRDVYLIQAQDPETQRVRVFRNEDALLYLKLSSADLQARATALSRGEELRTAAIRHYGWRIPVLSVFPNALSLKEVEPGYRHRPVLWPLMLVTLGVGAGFVTWRLRKRKKLAGPAFSAGSGPDRSGTRAPGGAASTDDAAVSAWLSSDDRRTGGSVDGGSDASGSSGSSGGGGSDA